LWSGGDGKRQEWTLNRRPIDDQLARRTPCVQLDAVVQVVAPGLSAAGRDVERGWASAPIVNVGTGHGEDRSPRGPRTRRHARLRASGALGAEVELVSDAGKDPYSGVHRMAAVEFLARLVPHECNRCGYNALGRP
jgi:hypothetical protein